MSVLLEKKRLGWQCSGKKLNKNKKKETAFKEVHATKKNGTKKCRVNKPWSNYPKC